MVHAMTGRIGAMSIDGTLVSETDIARMQAEEALHAAPSTSNWSSFFTQLS